MKKGGIRHHKLSGPRQLIRWAFMYSVAGCIPVLSCIYVSHIKIKRGTNGRHEEDETATNGTSSKKRKKQD